jgi:hypothetical protein
MPDTRSNGAVARDAASTYLTLVERCFARRFEIMTIADRESLELPEATALLDELETARQQAAALPEPPAILQLASLWMLEEPELRALEVLAAAEACPEGDGSLSWDVARVLAGLGLREAQRAFGRDGALRREGLVERRGQSYRIGPRAARLLLGHPLSDADVTRLARSNLAPLLSNDQQKRAQPVRPATEAPGPAVPYGDDLDYLQEEAARLRLLVERYDSARAHEDDLDGGSMRALRRQERLDRIDGELARRAQRCDQRMKATRRAGAWRPRIEMLVERLGLNAFERDVLLYLSAAHADASLRRRIGSPDVDDLLALLGADDIRRQVEGRAAFYRNATLIKEGIIEIDLFKNDLGRSDVLIDPRMLDHLLGLDSEAMHLAGSHLYEPDVRLKDVAISADLQERVVRTVEHFEAFQRVRRRLGLDDRLPYGRGLVLLFHGPSGTGKTMLANALARHVRRRLMLVNAGPSFFESPDRKLRYLIREARLQNAVLFFDECEGFFKERDAELLTEIERHDGLIILATNRPHELHEAMQRRVTLAVAFEKPDRRLRCRIWRSLLPPPEALAADVDPEALAERFDLTGGLIKNAVLAAVAAAAARDEHDPCISQHDLEAGARAQLDGRLNIGQRTIGFGRHG